MNLNYSVNDEKDSKKRIHYISNRIKKLEKDISEIKKKENKSSLLNQNSKIIDNKYVMTIDESKLKSKMKFIFTNSQKDLIKNNLTFNGNKNNNSLTKNNNNNKKHFLRKILRKPSNCSNIIPEKKNAILNLNSQLNKRFQRNNFLKNDNQIFNSKIKPSSDNNIRKIRPFFSFDESYKSNIINDKIKNDNKKNMNIYKVNNKEKLEYEFEIRRLKRELNQLKEENNKIKEKLDNIKNINKDLMQSNIFLNESQNNILNELMILSRQNILYNNSSNEQEGEYADQNSNYNFPLENLMLNIMDIKYYYENSLLVTQFFEGVNKMLNKIPLYNREIKSNNTNLLKKINELIDIKNNLDNTNNKYKYLLEENNKYYNYFSSLLNNLNLKNFLELEEFIKNLYLKNLKEDDQMEKIKDTLINETNSTKHNKEKKINYFSSNHVINRINNIYNTNSINFSKLRNYISNKNSDSRINKKKISYYITNKRLHNFNNKQFLNRTDQIENFNQNYIINLKNQTDYFPSFYIKNNSYMYDKHNSNFESKKMRKIKANYLYNDKKLNNNFYSNGTYNSSNKFINQSIFFNNDEDINFNEINNNFSGKKELKKHYTCNNLNKKGSGHIKNHSVFIFNQ